MTAKRDENRRATQHENWKEIAKIGRAAYDKKWARPINRQRGD